MTRKEAIEILQAAISDAEFQKSHFERPQWGCLHDEQRAKLIEFSRKQIETYTMAIEALKMLESLETPTEIPY